MVAAKAPHFLGLPRLRATSYGSPESESDGLTELWAEEAPVRQRSDSFASRASSRLSWADMFDDEEWIQEGGGKLEEQGTQQPDEPFSAPIDRLTTAVAAAPLSSSRSERLNLVDEPNDIPGQSHNMGPGVPEDGDDCKSRGQLKSAGKASSERPPAAPGAGPPTQDTQMPRRLDTSCGLAKAGRRTARDSKEPSRHAFSSGRPPVEKPTPPSGFGQHDSWAGRGCQVFEQQALPPQHGTTWQMMQPLLPGVHLLLDEESNAIAAPVWTPIPGLQWAAAPFGQLAEASSGGPEIGIQVLLLGGGTICQPTTMAGGGILSGAQWAASPAPAPRSRVCGPTSGKKHRIVPLSGKVLDTGATWVV